MRIYETAAGKSSIQAFVNIGGAWANMGTDAKVLKLNPGLNRIEDLPEPARRGALYEMAARSVPVLHLLFIKGLAQQYGLAWDPVPLPSTGRGQIYQFVKQKHPAFLLLAGLYFVLVIVVLALWNVYFRRAYDDDSPL
jgi:hypothetical protein